MKTQLPWMRRAALAAALTVVSIPCWAAVQASEAWIRWLPSGLPAGAYVTLHNDGSQDVKLVSVSSPAYAMPMLHRSHLEDGKMVMSGVEAITVPAHGELALKPGGYHIMLMQARREVHPGMHLPLTLNFDDGEQLRVKFEVRKSDGDHAASPKMPAMDMSTMPGMSNK